MHSSRSLLALATCLLFAGCGGGSGGGNDASTPGRDAGAFSIGGTVTGLEAGDGVLLRNNGGDDLPVAADGNFAFATAVTGAYAVTIGRQPLWRDCAVADGSGTATADVTGVGVSCAPYVAYVSTEAGSGANAEADGTGLAAAFYVPSGMAADDEGNLYVADQGGRTLRKIAPGNVVTTLASGLGQPGDVAIGPDGHLYVADGGANKILRITPDGTVTTYAGTGAGGADDGDRSTATFVYPFALAFDRGGNLYIADALNHRIRKITPSGTVSTLAGTGMLGDADGPGATATFRYPQGIAVDDGGFVYVADASNNKIRRIAPDGTVSTFAGSGLRGEDDGPGATARFREPFGLAFGRDGALYVADYENSKLRRISREGMVTTIAGTDSSGTSDGPASTATLKGPIGVAFDRAGNLYFSTESNHIRKLGRP